MTDLPIVGICAGSCNRALPVGYLFVVTKWEAQPRGTGKVQVPAEIWCRECAANLEGQKRPRRKRMPASPPDVKQIAIKLYSVVSATEPHGSKKLAQLAGLEYSDLVLEILKKLRAAGKVQFKEGRWLKA